MSHYLLHEVLKKPKDPNQSQSLNSFPILRQRLQENPSPKKRSQLKTDLMLLLCDCDAGPRVARLLKFLLE